MILKNAKFASQRAYAEIKEVNARAKRIREATQKRQEKAKEEAANIVAKAQNEAQAIEAAAKLAKSKADEAKKPKTLLMTMGGNVADYNPAKITKIRSELALKLGVSAGSIEISVKAGSVVLSVTVPATAAAK